jgi:hypothetical protein
MYLFFIIKFPYVLIFYFHCTFNDPLPSANPGLMLTKMWETEEEGKGENDGELGMSNDEMMR